MISKRTSPSVGSALVLSYRSYRSKFPPLSQERKPGWVSVGLGGAEPGDTRQGPGGQGGVWWGLAKGHGGEGGVEFKGEDGEDGAGVHPGRGRAEDRFTW